MAQELRFVTLDYWKSEEDFASFRSQHQAEYGRLDEELEKLTEEERRLGVF